MIEDLGSRNGTFVNGQRVRFPVPLAHGDQVAFGRVDASFTVLAPLGSTEPSTG